MCDKNLMSIMMNCVMNNKELKENGYLMILQTKKLKFHSK